MSSRSRTSALIRADQATAAQARALPAATGIAALSSMSRRRIGLNTNQASNAAAMFIAAATMNTACQLPVAVVNTLDRGTSSDAVPLAVYSSPAFAAANLLPNVSAFVD